MSGGVPDILSHSRLARLVADMKSRADVARTEAVTGRYEDVTKANNGDIGGVHLLLKAVEDAKAYQSTLSLAETRAGQTQAAMASLTADTRRLATDTLSFLGRGDYVAMTTSAADAKATLSTMFSALSVSVAGRALFSGDAVDRAPLADVEDLISDVQAILAAAPDAASAEAALDTYFNDPAGGFETSIYAGGAGNAPDVEIAPGVRIAASVKANAQPIKDMMRSLAVIANFDTLPGGSIAERDALVTSAANLSIDAEDRLTDMRAAVGISEARISASKTRYEAEETVLTNVYNQKTANDPFEAAAALKALESQLEASYLMTARLSQLSLANFLR
ncbi:MAG: flagellin [Pseudomonadota bacterium]|nr:flagellin [Pseudomonadota bacterium]